ncbi:MAG: potassium-transporting ATPase subunit C [Nakamurella sp.]
MTATFAARWAAGRGRSRTGSGKPGCPVRRGRGPPAQQVNDLVESHRQGCTLGFISEERVNVLSLNFAFKPSPRPTSRLAMAVTR